MSMDIHAFVDRYASDVVDVKIRRGTYSYILTIEFLPEHDNPENCTRVSTTSIKLYFNNPEHVSQFVHKLNAEFLKLQDSDSHVL